jgi:hypothetical protein
MMLLRRLKEEVKILEGRRGRRENDSRPSSADDPDRSEE